MKKIAKIWHNITCKKEKILKIIIKNNKIKLNLIKNFVIIKKMENRKNIKLFLDNRLEKLMLKGKKFIILILIRHLRIKKIKNL